MGVIISEKENDLDRGVYGVYLVSDIAKMIDYESYNHK